MAVTSAPRVNQGTSGIIDDEGFRGFGSGGFDDNDLLIIGDEVDDILTGGTGHDEIEGKDGNDTLNGGDGNDTLEGDAGNDVLDGQGGTGEKDKDKLFGDAGNDILLAGAGFDELTGGSGNDIFGFYGLGHFRINDFSFGEDQLFFDFVGLDLAGLLAAVNRVEKDATGDTVYFGATEDASIELVGINVSDITPEMIVFEI